MKAKIVGGRRIRVNQRVFEKIREKQSKRRKYSDIKAKDLLESSLRGGKNKEQQIDKHKEQYRGGQKDLGHHRAGEVGNGQRSWMPWMKEEGPENLGGSVEESLEKEEKGRILEEKGETVAPKSRGGQKDLGYHRAGEVRKDQRSWVPRMKVEGPEILGAAEERSLEKKRRKIISEEGSEDGTPQSRGDQKDLGSHRAGEVRRDQRSWATWTKAKWSEILGALGKRSREEIEGRNGGQSESRRSS